MKPLFASAERPYLLRSQCNMRRAAEGEPYDCGEMIKHVEWSADGQLYLVTTSDNRVLTFDGPHSMRMGVDRLLLQQADSMLPLSVVTESGPIHAAAMHASGQSFLSCSSAAPVHLWNCATGARLASYRVPALMERQSQPLSCAWARDGAAAAVRGGGGGGGEQQQQQQHHRSTFFVGDEQALHMFDVNRVAAPVTSGWLQGVSERRSRRELFATLAVTSRRCVAVGSYASGDVTIVNDGQTVCTVRRVHPHGVSWLRWSEDGLRLYSGGRKSAHIFQHDVRMLVACGGEAHPSVTYERPVDTFQRFSFDVKGAHLFSGNGRDGRLSLWNTDSASSQVVVKDSGHGPINCVAVHPTLPFVLCSAGSSRTFSHPKTTPTIQLYEAPFQANVDELRSPPDWSE